MAAIQPTARSKTPNKYSPQISLDKYDAKAQESAILVEDGRLVTVEVFKSKKKKKKKQDVIPENDGVRVSSAFDKTVHKSMDGELSSKAKDRKSIGKTQSTKTKDKNATIVDNKAEVTASKETPDKPTDTKLARKDGKAEKSKLATNQGKREIVSSKCQEKPEAASSPRKPPSKTSRSPLRNNRSASPTASAKASWKTRPLPGGTKPNDLLRMLFQMWPMQRTRSFRPAAVSPKRQRSAQQNLTLVRKWSRKKRKTRVAGITVEASVVLSKRSLSQAQLPFSF